MSHSVNINQECSILMNYNCTEINNPAEMNLLYKEVLFWFS